MDLYSALVGAMFIISTALRYPVIMALLMLVAWSFIAVGLFVSEYTARNRDIGKLRAGCRTARAHMRMQEFDKACDSLRASGSNDLLKQFINELSGFIGADHGDFITEAEKLLQEYELKITKELEKLRLVVKWGPMLGLMGTLIPLGPALMGLTAGNIQQLAENLVVAFSTTVLGLFSGGIAYALLIVKKRWYTQDLSDMEYIVEVLSSRNAKKETDT